MRTVYVVTTFQRNCRTGEIATHTVGGRSLPALRNTVFDAYEDANEYRWTCDGIGLDTLITPTVLVSDYDES